MGMYDKPEDGVGFRRGRRVDPGISDFGPSLAKQEFREECDINVLMKGYEKGKAITHLNQYDGRYEDVTSVLSYHEAHNAVIKAEEMFLTVPAQIREQFDNDPGKFLEFATNEENRDKLVEMGLARAPAPAQRVEVVNQVAPASPEGGEKK